MQAIIEGIAFIVLLIIIINAKHIKHRGLYESSKKSIKN